MNNQTKNNNFIKEWDSSSEAGRILGIGSSHIRECCLGKKYYKAYKNFYWHYKKS